MSQPTEWLKALVKHPTTILVTGLIMFISGGTEMAYDFIDTEENFRLGAHHGVALFGFIQVMGSLPDIIDGRTRYFDASEKRAPREAP
jgi:hypothetical protein